MLFTFGKHKTASGKTTDKSWEDYIKYLHSKSRIGRSPKDKDVCTPWTCPIILKPDAPDHKKPSVARMSSFAGADIDAQGWTLDRLQSRLSGVESVLYTTTKSRPEWQRWRVLVKLDQEYETSQHSAVWKFLNDLFDGGIDPLTKNENRVLYVPAAWHGADNIFIHNPGYFIPVESIFQNYEPTPVVQSVSTAFIGEVKPPIGMEIIPQYMIDKFNSSQPGGRFFVMMCQAAARYRENNWHLSADDLMNAALAISPYEQESKTKRLNAKLEAEKALGYIDTIVKPLTPIQKMRKRMGLSTMTFNK